MPYITKAQRDHLNSDPRAIPLDVGELTYVLHWACARYLRSQPDKYQARAEVLGALECAKQEFYRSEVIPYEDVKRNLNGGI